MKMIKIFKFLRGKIGIVKKSENYHFVNWTWERVGYNYEKNN